MFDDAAALPAHGVGRPGRMLQLVPAQHNSQQPGIVYEHNRDYPRPPLLFSVAHEIF